MQIFNLRILFEKKNPEHQQNIFYVSEEFKNVFDRVWHKALGATLKYNINASSILMKADEKAMIRNRPIESNSTYCTRHQTGKEHKQLRRHKVKQHKRKAKSRWPPGYLK